MIATLFVVAAFLVGSIPFGLLIGRAFYQTDIREHGSGNIGAMNALRTMGKTGAIAVLLLDALKGFIPAFLALHWAALPNPPLTAALAAAASVAGHCFSPWLGWKGGKGVATSFGAIFALNPLVGLCAVAGWLAGAALTRYSSVGSMLGNLVAPFAFWALTRNPWFAAYGAFAAILIIYTHRENIGRLREGRENPIRLSRSKSA